MHRIGRTGRSGRTGIATTFINKANDESVLLDLKHLLMEAKQKVPPFLLELCSENEKYLNLGGKVTCDRICIFISFIRKEEKTRAFIIFQTNVDAVIAVVLVIESQNVLNWRLSKTNKHPILDAVITWPAMQLTIKSVITKKKIFGIILEKYYFSLHNVVFCTKDRLL